MKLKTTILALALGASMNASSFEVFKQTFDDGLGGTLGAGITEALYSNSRNVNCGSHCTTSNSAAFSDNNQGDNWGVHDGYHNKWVSGNANGVIQRGYTGNAGSAMTGNVLGHIKNYNPNGANGYDNNEQSQYEIRGIDLASDWTNIQLMFDFDSWIRDAGTNSSSWSNTESDGFAVSYNDGSGWNLLDPTDASDMHYRNLGNNNNYWWNGTEYVWGPGLNDATGFDPSASDYNCDGDTTSFISSWNQQQCGFDGHNPNAMMGVAMFDLTGLANSTIDLRFSFDSDTYGVAEGINIDNIKLTAVCVNGNNGPGCGGDSGQSIPEPASLALMMLGGTALYRRRKHT